MYSTASIAGRKLSINSVLQLMKGWVWPGTDAVSP